jgi:hypothetical protein
MGSTRLIRPSPYPALPSSRGQQQLHLQLRGLNSDPRGAKDEVEGDLGQCGMRESTQGWVYGEATRTGLRAHKPTWAPLFIGFPSSHSTWEAFSLDRQSGFSWSGGEEKTNQCRLLQPLKIPPYAALGPHHRVQGPDS